MQHQGDLLRDEALDRLEQAHEDWITAATETVEKVARENVLFTTDDIWKVVGDPPKEPRAMGAVMRRAANQELCEATSHFRPSDRPECHRNPKRVWHSLIYGKRQ